MGKNWKLVPTETVLDNRFENLIGQKILLETRCKEQQMTIEFLQKKLASFEEENGK